MIPVSFELKRMVGERGIGWKPELRRWLPGAPVYVISAANGNLFGTSDAGLILPHDRMLIECELPPQRAWSHYVTFVMQDDVGFLAYPFLRRRVDGRWTSAEIEASYDRASGFCSWAPNPRTPREHPELRDILYSVIAVVFALGDALKHGDGSERTASVNIVQRRKFAGPGVTGWIYRMIDIGPALQRQRSKQGGTHASPRWHIRRGHWRTLSGGRRTFVRECEVGDPAQGGVVKDYRVQTEARA